MSDRTQYQALNLGQYGRPKHRSRTSAAFSQLYGIIHTVVGAVLPLAFAFQFIHKDRAVGHEPKLEFWYLDAFYIYLFGASILAVVAMHIFRMMQTHNGLEHYQAASVYIKGGATLFLGCGMLQGVFKLGSVIDGSCEQCSTIDAVEAGLSIVFVLVLWLFVCAHSNKCVMKGKRFARLAFMLLWATCISCWCRDFVREVVEDLTYQTFNSSEICRIRARSIIDGNDSLEKAYQYHVSGGGDDEQDFSKIRENSSAFLVPGAMEFYLIMSGFMYVMYGNIGQRQDQDEEAHRQEPPKRHHTLRGSYIGLGLGLVLLMTSIAIVITHVLSEGHKEDEGNGVPSIIYYGFALAVYPLSITGNLIAHVTMRRSDEWQIDDDREDELRLTTVLLFISASGMFFSSAFGIVAAAQMPDSVHEPVLLLIHECAKVVDIFAQVIFLYDALHRKPPENFNPTFTRQIMMLMMFISVTFWWTSIYELKDVRASPIQYCFYGFEVWSVVLHLTNPLAIYFRFHSSILYLEIWTSG